jgi:hypothetical protein
LWTYFQKIGRTMPPIIIPSLLRRSIHSELTQIRGRYLVECVFISPFFPEKTRDRVQLLFGETHFYTEGSHVEITIGSLCCEYSGVRYGAVYERGCRPIKANSICDTSHDPKKPVSKAPPVQSPILGFEPYRKVQVNRVESLGTDLSLQWRKENDRHQRKCHGGGSNCGLLPMLQGFVKLH